MLTGGPTDPPAEVTPPEPGSVPAAPAAVASAASPVDAATDPLNIDQLVGQINGRPVYADEFFEPMDARFRREAERLRAREWVAFARKEIESALWDKLRDELLLAEFQGALSPEQRQGVFAFIDDVRRDLVSGNLGSEALATKRLRESEGLGLEEKIEDVTQREFIAFQLRKAIGGRVNISARDVELYYEQNIDQFSPPPVAGFVILRVPLSDEPRLREAEAAVASSEPFEASAAKLSTWRPSDGNKAEVTLTTRDYTTATLFGPAPLNNAARALRPGEVTPRVDHSGDAYWIKLRAIDQKPGKSLYDAQTEIQEKLRVARVREEETRYFEQLFRRGSFSDVKEMTARLLAFAAERYLVQRELEGAAAAPAPAAGTPPAQEK